MTRIAGVVHDRDGAPLEWARVAFAEGPTALPDIAAVTGADGRFALSAPVPGRYRLMVAADGCLSRHVVVEVADSQVEVDVTLAPAEG